VTAAREAFETGPWSTYTGAQRAALMNKLADLIDANLEEIVKAESQAMGQPVAVASNFIVPAAAACWRYYAGELPFANYLRIWLITLCTFTGWADKIEGQTLADEKGFFRMIRYEPQGVCAGIGPWNVSVL
jgi:aldehyde dehydrogenase (NAD+)